MYANTFPNPLQDNVDSTTVEGTGAALTDAGTPAELGRWPRQTVFSDGDMGETGMH
jgi:hypothetical protein